MVSGAGRLELAEHPAQRGLPQPAHRPRGQPQPVVVPGDEALPLELVLQLAQCPQVRGGVRAEVPLECLHVHVVQRRPGQALAQLLLQRLEVGELGHRLHGGAVPQRLPAGPHRDRVTAQPGAQRAQVVGQLRHLRGEVGVGERVAHQLGELLPLVGRERGHHPVRRGLASGERVDQLVDVLGMLGEQVAVPIHELREPVRGVLAAGVGGEQRVQVGEHVLDPLHRGRVVGGQRLLEPRELRVEDLPAQHLLDRLVGRPRLRRVPGVVVEGTDGAGHVVGDGGELHLRHAGVVTLLPGQGVPLRGERLVEHRPDLVQGAAEVALAAGPLAHPAYPLGQVVEPAPAVETTTHQLPQRLTERPSGQHLAADLVERLADVVRRRERVRAPRARGRT